MNWLCLAVDVDAEFDRFNSHTSGHCIVAVVKALREGKGKVGLIHGNGEVGWDCLEVIAWFLKLPFSS
jgi:hypothetical protein